MTVGIFGGGQLGLMLGEAGKKIGVDVMCFDPSKDAPAKKTARMITAPYDDEKALEELTKQCDVMTYEFENVPVEAISFVRKKKPVFPHQEALKTAQDRLLEKTLFKKLSIPTPLFADVQIKNDLFKAIQEIGLPAILKTRRMGYDGKGQVVIRAESEIDEAWNALRSQSLILEEFIPFDRELSVIAVRAQDGTSVFYPLIENVHRNGILHRSTAPANVTNDLTKQAQSAATMIMDALSYVGVLTIEFFEKDGTLIANEMAPRVHNSGHWTIEGAATSQFENHLRAVAGMELGSTEMTKPSVMFNMIGTIPDLSSIGKNPDVFIHLYGKEPRSGRKLGHITMLNPSEQKIEEIEKIV